MIALAIGISLAVTVAGEIVYRWARPWKTNADIKDYGLGRVKPRV